jgi:uncharacterized membrane protein YebE (DUF533 family)
VLDAEDVLNGLVRGALRGRRKSSRRAGRALRGSGLINARTILAAAGVAWGLYETWQQQAGSSAGAALPASGVPGSTVPPPLPAPGVPALPEPVVRLMRLMISAAGADGEIGPAERDKILAEAREVGADALVARELEAPRPLGEIVAGVTDPQLKEQLYTLAFALVRADETVTGAERIYLAQLANKLGLDAAAVKRLEAGTAARIDAAGGAGAPTG